MVKKESRAKFLRTAFFWWSFMAVLLSVLLVVGVVPGSLSASLSIMSCVVIASLYYASYIICLTIIETSKDKS